MRTDEYKRRVEDLARSGRPLAEIEAMIDTAPLSSGQKAALWLLAWSYEKPREQRRIARDTLEALS